MTTPAGSWPSPIDAQTAVAAGRGLEAVAFAGADLWWSESRPSEGGRTVVCRAADAPGETVDVLPAPHNARSSVQEYGGTSWLPVPGAAGSELVFVEFTDQRLYLMSPDLMSPDLMSPDLMSPDLLSPTDGVVRPLTPEPPIERGLRYADLRLDAARGRIMAVRESHRGDGTHGTVDRTLVGVPLDGSGADDPSAVVDLLADLPGWRQPDFLACPRLAPGGDALVFISWNHPDLPWDSTICWLAPVSRLGKLGAPVQIAGGAGVSITDPGFTPDGSVLLMSDESGWWQPILVDRRTRVRRRLSEVETEFAAPLWVLGRRNWASVPGGRILVRPDGRPAILDTFDESLTELDPAWTSVNDLTAEPDGRMALVVGGDTMSGRVVLIDVDGRRSVVRTEGDTELPAGYVPLPRTTVAGGVHAVVYPPTNPGFAAAAGTAPLIITIHGGPTAQHLRTLSARTAYFTSRGFAVVAVDYHGSTGYGRPYRDALRGRWADLDIADAMTIARALIADGTAGAALISGGSAGGLTVLGALTTPGNPFAAGTSMYGIGDLVALDADTHDFESSYQQGLLGPDLDVWIARSPLTNAARLATPVLLLQGGQDKIVTPNQAELFAAACETNKVPYALIVFPDEGHGFRAGATRVRALESELSFYGQVLGFETPGVPGLTLVRP